MMSLEAKENPSMHLKILKRFGETNSDVQRCLPQLQFGSLVDFREAFHFLQGYPVCHMFSLSQDNMISTRSWPRRQYHLVGKFLNEEYRDQCVSYQFYNWLAVWPRWAPGSLVIKYYIPFTDDTQDFHKDQINERIEHFLKHANCCGLTTYYYYS